MKNNHLSGAVLLFSLWVCSALGSFVLAEPAPKIFRPNGVTHQTLVETCRRKLPSACDRLAMCRALVKHFASHPPTNLFEPLTSSAFPMVRPLPWTRITKVNLDEHRTMLEAVGGEQGANVADWWILNGVLDESLDVETVALAGTGVFDGDWIRARPSLCRSRLGIGDAQQTASPLGNDCNWMRMGISNEGKRSAAVLPDEYVIYEGPARRSRTTNPTFLSVQWDRPQDPSAASKRVINVGGDCEIQLEDHQEKRK